MTAWLRDNARGLVIAVIAAGFLAYSGAFGTSQAPHLVRMAYWAILMIGGGLMGALTVSLVQHFGIFETRHWAQALLTIAICTGPITLLVFTVTAGLLAGPRELAHLLDYLPSALTVTAAMTALNYATDRKSEITTAAAEAATTVRFRDRLPAKLREAELFAVEAQDHYLRLHTALGSDLILMRLADAIAELEGIEGARTHRSWWVARQAVVEAVRSDGRATLTLRNGVQVPVSRTYASGLREAGWF